mmetsp:Transcript_181802/g.576997  ORF Transcript_181802/g.576997 Transcript_181802/m.576997 type:complete len:89 (-) Transcript_181802:4-270(-)
MVIGIATHFETAPLGASDHKMTWTIRPSWQHCLQAEVGRAWAAKIYRQPVKYGYRYRDMPSNSAAWHLRSEEGWDDQAFMAALEDRNL